jgi:hypothetical protein
LQNYDFDHIFNPPAYYPRDVDGVLWNDDILCNWVNASPVDLLPPNTSSFDATLVDAISIIFTSDNNIHIPINVNHNVNSHAYQAWSIQGVFGNDDILRD